MSIISQTFSEMFSQFGQMWMVFSQTWYWSLPIPFYLTFKFFWKNHVQGEYAGSLNWILLEIIPPKDIEKSPQPMESLYAGMQGVEKGYNTFEEFLDGQFPASFSLEIVSDGGDVHFYIRTQRSFRNLVEAHLYAQYPDCMIKEVPDYVDQVPRVIPNEKWDLWGSDLEFVKHDAYPIKTYKYFEESVTGKMIDPLSGVIEALGKLPPGQKLWYQIIISPHKPSWASKEGRVLVDKLKGKEAKKGSIFGDIGKDITDVISNIVKAAATPIEFSSSEKKKDEAPLEFRLSPGEKDVLKAVEENLGKLQFFTKMRFLLIGKRESFDKSNISSFMGGIKQFGDDNLNSLKPHADSKTYANYIFKKPRLRYRQRKILRRYRERSNDGVRFTMSTEELATMYHLPDMSVVAPTLQRVEAKHGGAPMNLPVE